MRKAIVACALALGATVSGSAFADDYITNWGKVTKLIAYEDTFRVYGLNLAPNPAACSSTTSAYVQEGLASAKKEGLNRALLAALLSGRDVKVMLSFWQCTSDGYPVITGMTTR